MRLLKPNELPDDWDPTTDKRLTNWEMVHHLIRVLEAGGEVQRRTWSRSLGARRRLPANSAIACIPCVNVRNAQPRRYPIMPWSKAGRRSPGWRERDERGRVGLKQPATCSGERKGVLL